LVATRNGRTEVNDDRDIRIGLLAGLGYFSPGPNVAEIGMQVYDLNVVGSASRAKRRKDSTHDKRRD
jgi:hypothetical protein